MKKRYKFGIIGLSVALVAALVFVLIPAGVTINQGGFLSIGTEVVLAVNAPPDIEMTEKSRSPGEITYYFDSVSTTIWTDYGFFVDNILTNYAYTNVDGETETLDGNTCPGTDLGVITKVEIRAYAYNSDGDDRIDLWVAGGFIGDEHQTTPASSPGWGTYQNITSDANAPSPWTWSDVVAVDVDVEFDKVGKGNVVLCSKVEIKVTYGEAPKGGSVAFVRATEGTIVATTLTLNIEVSVGTDRVLVVGLAYKDNSVLTPTSIFFGASEYFTLEKTASDGGDAQCFLYYLVAPTETTANAVIVMPGSVRMVGYVAYFTGVDQSSPFTAATSEAQGVDAAPTVDVSSAADEIVIDIMAQVSGGPDTITSNTGTKICDGAATGGGSDTRGGGQYDTGATPVTMGYTMSDTDNWNIIAGALQEPSLPTVTTRPVGNKRKTTAIGYGQITDTGGEEVTKRGVCWNTTGNPTVADSKSEETGSFGVGYFLRPMTGLSAGQHYYLKAYAYNSVGYGYGSQVEFDALPTDSEILLPNAVGDETAIASQAPGSGAHWEKVDEDSPDNNNTRVYNVESPYQRDLYNLPAHSGSGTIDKIVVHFRCKTNDADYGNYKASIKSDSTTTDGTEKTPSVDNLWEDFSQEWVNNPADSQAWEWTDIDALQIGISLDSNMVGVSTDCTQVYVVVYYTTGAEADISNLPISKAFSVVSTSSTYWSNGSEPTWPLVDGDAYFTVTNNGATCSITIVATDFTGGVGWTLAGTPAENTVTLVVFEEGDGSGDGLTLTTSPQAFIAGLGASADKDWELKFLTATSHTDGAEKTSTITLVATLD